MRTVDVCTSDRLPVEISGTGAFIGTKNGAHWGASCFLRLVRIRSRADKREKKYEKVTLRASYRELSNTSGKS